MNLNGPLKILVICLAVALVLLALLMYDPHKNKYRLQVELKKVVLFQNNDGQYEVKEFDPQLKALRTGVALILKKEFISENPQHVFLGGGIEPGLDGLSGSIEQFAVIDSAGGEMKDISSSLFVYDYETHDHDITSGSLQEFYNRKLPLDSLVHFLKTNNDLVIGSVLNRERVYLWRVDSTNVINPRLKFISHN